MGGSNKKWPSKEQITMIWTCDADERKRPSGRPRTDRLTKLERIQKLGINTRKQKVGE